MVFINNQKFACESCIKGHRSSSCHHTDRPLFEIKKKGRPVSQCEKCRELRKTKRVHSKCDCTFKDGSDPPLKQLAGKSKRFIPIIPALPNGLKDAYPQPSSVEFSDPRGKVNVLLNPCHCESVWHCQCRMQSTSNEGLASTSNRHLTNIADHGLETLARAAALFQDQSSIILHQLPAASHNAVSHAQQESISEKHPRGCCGATDKGDSSHSKRPRHHSPSSQSSPLPEQRGPALPPILRMPSPGAQLLDTPLPVFPAIPPLSSVASLAGSGCTCGFRCSCPGCVEHRGPAHASKDHTDCPDECGTCVDYEGGIELPCGRSAASNPTPSFIDAFLARAAALPLPPPQRSINLALDPMNVTVYPASLFTGEANHMDERGPAFGLVRVPKLECCAGRCGCPDGRCGCGKNCDGCCTAHGNDGSSSGTPSLAANQAAGDGMPATTVESLQKSAGSSCCSAKALSARQ